MLEFITKKLPKIPDKLDCVLKPISNDLSELENSLIKSLMSGNTELDRMTKYILASGGKRLRPALVILFARAVSNGHLTPQQRELAEAVEMVHTASLLHDDIIDNADTRRGIPVVGKKWGARSAVIAGDFILSRALGKLVLVGTPAVRLFANTLNDLCIGEILQKNQKNSIISIDDYVLKSERKTARLFMAAVESTVLVMPGADNCLIRAARDYSLNFGIAFQIIDDILNFTKAGASDLKDGIITAPAIYAAYEYAKNNDFTLKNMLEKGLKNEKDFKRALKLITNSNGINFARLLAEKYAQRSVKALNIIEKNCYRETLRELAGFVTERDF